MADMTKKSPSRAGRCRSGGRGRRDAEALALGRLIEPELHAALVTVDAHGADLQLPKVRLGYAGHLQALRWIRREPEPQAVRTDG